MSLLNQMYINFCKNAMTIPGFKIGQKEDVPYDITHLANCYCKAYDTNDKVKMNQYISALMVRYWHMIPYLHSKSKSAKLEIEDMVSWVYEGFCKAFKYRSWQDPTKQVSRDPKGAEKCFNQCITSVRQNWYRYFNTEKVKLNYQTYSLDSLYEKFGDTVEDFYLHEYSHSYSSCNDLISNLIARNKLFEALVVDRICYGDIIRNSPTKKIITNLDVSYKITKDNYSFDYSKLIQSIKMIDEEYLRSLFSSSTVDCTRFKQALDIPNRQLKVCVMKVLNDLKQDKEVISILC